MPASDSTEPSPHPILRWQHKYRHPTNNRYIIVYFEVDNRYDEINKFGIGPNLSQFGTPIASMDIACWSLYDNNDENFHEEHVNTAGDFDNMIESEGWEKVGEGEFVVME